jgi:hypothetical protein
VRYFRIPSFTGIEAHRDDADRGSLCVVEGCVPKSSGGIRSAPVWDEIGRIDVSTSTNINQLYGIDELNGNSFLFVSRGNKIHDMVIMSQENTEVGTLGDSYTVASSTPYTADEAPLTPIGNRLYSIGDGSADSTFLGLGPVDNPNFQVKPDLDIYKQEFENFPKCKFFVQGPKKTIFGAGNPDKPLTIYISEPAGITTPHRDSIYSEQLSSVDIIGSNANYITALTSRGDQIVVHTDKGCHLLFAPKPDQAETGYRVEQAPATNFSASVGIQVVGGESGTQPYWLAFDGQLYKDESVARGAEDFKTYSDPSQVSWKAKGVWDRQHPTDLSNSFATYSASAGMYWAYTQDKFFLDRFKNSPPIEPFGLVFHLDEFVAPSTPEGLAYQFVQSAPKEPTELTGAVTTKDNPAEPTGLTITDVLYDAPSEVTITQLDFIPDAPSVVTEIIVYVIPDAPSVVTNVTTDLLPDAPSVITHVEAILMPDAPSVPTNANTVLLPDAPSVPTITVATLSPDAPSVPTNAVFSLLPDAPSEPTNLQYSLDAGTTPTPKPAHPVEVGNLSFTLVPDAPSVPTGLQGNITAVEPGDETNEPGVPTGLQGNITYIEPGDETNAPSVPTGLQGNITAVDAPGVPTGLQGSITAVDAPSVPTQLQLTNVVPDAPSIPYELTGVNDSIFRPSEPTDLNKKLYEDKPFFPWGLSYDVEYTKTKLSTPQYVVRVTNSEISVQLDPVPYASFYEINFSPDSEGFQFIIIRANGSLSHTFNEHLGSSLMHGQDYFVRVLAMGEGEYTDSEYSDWSTHRLSGEVDPFVVKMWISSLDDLPSEPSLGETVMYSNGDVKTLYVFDKTEGTESGYKWFSFPFSESQYGTEFPSVPTSLQHVSTQYSISDKPSNPRGLSGEIVIEKPSYPNSLAYEVFPDAPSEPYNATSETTYSPVMLSTPSVNDNYFTEAQLSFDISPVTNGYQYRSRLTKRSDFWRKDFSNSILRVHPIGNYMVTKNGVWWDMDDIVVDYEGLEPNTRYVFEAWALGDGKDFLDSYISSDGGKTDLAPPSNPTNLQYTYTIEWGDAPSHPTDLQYSFEFVSGDPPSHPTGLNVPYQATIPGYGR